MERMEELKKKVESLLFSSGRKMHVSEISRLVGNIDVEAIKKALAELKEKYKEDSSLMVMQEGDEWKLTVKERYIPIVHKIVTKTELTKTIMETLAVIAYKAPVLQSEIIKIRTNKAYDHLKELDESGYISRTKHGRTKMIKLTPKFFEYFDIPPDKLREKFKDVKQLEKAVEEKEQELHEKKAEIDQKKEEMRERGEEHKKKTAEQAEKLDKEIEDIKASTEVDIFDKKGKKHKLKQYASEKVEGTEFEEPEPTMPPYKEKVGKLDVYEHKMTPKEKEEFVKEAEREKTIEEKEEKTEEAKEKEAEAAKELGVEPEEAAAEEAPAEAAAPEEKYSLIGEEKPAEEEKKEGVEEVAEEVKEAIKPKLKEEGGAEEAPAEEISPETIEEHARRIAKAELAKKPVDFKGERLFAKGIPKEIQEQIDKRVEEIIYGKKKEAAEKEKKEEKEEEEGEEKGLPY